MTRNRAVLAVLAVAAGLLVAGAVGGGAAVGDAGTAQENGTADDPANESLPPGVGADGAVNASVLVAAHEAALAETGYVFELETASSSGLGGLEQRATQSGVVEAGLTAFSTHTVNRLTSRNRTVVATVDLWGNDSRVVVRIRRANTTRFRTFNRTRFAEGDAPSPGLPGTVAPEEFDFDAAVTQSALLRRVLLAADFTVVGSERAGGQTLYTLEAESLNRSAFPDPDNVTRLDASLVVADDGRVHDLSYDVVVETGRTNRTLSATFDVTRLGPVEAPLPGWAARSVAGVGNATATG